MIVNPWVFYVMSICDGILTTAVFAAIFSGIAALIIGIMIGIACVDGNENEIKTISAVAKVLIAVFSVAMLVFIVTPSENTILMMQAARLATADNVNAVFEALKSAIDYAAGVLK